MGLRYDDVKNLYKKYDSKNTQFYNHLLSSVGACISAARSEYLKAVGKHTKTHYYGNYSLRFFVL